MEYRELVEHFFSSHRRASWYPVSQKLSSLKPCLCDYLAEEDIRDNLHMAALPDLWLDELNETAKIIKEDKHLLSLYRFILSLMNDKDDLYGTWLFQYWPTLEPYLGKRHPQLWLLVTLACIPPVIALHKELSIDDTVTHDTCSGIGTKALDYYFYFGELGVDPLVVHWFQHHMKGDLFRIGRLEYMVAKSFKDFYLYENRETGEYRLSLISPDTDEPITCGPEGNILSIQAEFDSKWKLVLKPGDYLLDMHIPGGGGLTLPVVRDSFTRALNFYKQLYPQQEFKGFRSQSWIYSPDLEGAYLKDSNLITLRDQLFLYPIETDRVDGLRFIYGITSKNPEDWPQVTSVQRRLKKHLEGGGSFRLSGMIYLSEDLGRLGDFPYKS